jgi:hypothetical protein
VRSVEISKIIAPGRAIVRVASHILVKIQLERGVKISISVIKVVHRVMWEGNYDS